MNKNSDTYHQEQRDLVSLYALSALPSTEADDVSTHISECVECRQELERLRPIVASFDCWPADILRPPAALWERLAERIAKETGNPPLLPPSQPTAKPEWEHVAEGISVQMLATDAEKHRVSLLVRLAPGTDYPAHRHAGVEELHLLSGELMVDEKKLYPGDFLEAKPGGVDHRVWSETGCTCVLLTSTDDTLL